MNTYGVEKKMQLLYEDASKQRMSVTLRSLYDRKRIHNNDRKNMKETMMERRKKGLSKVEKKSNWILSQYTFTHLQRVLTR